MDSPTITPLPLRVLAVDDDREILDLLLQGLQPGGFTLSVATSGEAALRELRLESFDVVLLDVDMPGLDGFQVLERLRHDGIMTPVMMITALNAEEDVVRGLEKGADGYVTKPFGLKELAARIVALHRRTELSRASVLTAGDLVIDERARAVTAGGQEIRLTNTEFRLLVHLAREAPRVISREELLREVWEMDFDPGTGLVDVHMGNLRKKLRGADVSLIETVRGEGFRIPLATKG